MHIQVIEFILLFIVLLFISIEDIKKRIIPNKYVVVLMVIWIPFIFLDQSLAFASSIAGFLIGGGFLLAAAIMTKGGIGLGDVKLVAALGLYVGVSHVIFGIMYGFILATVYTTIMMMLKKLKPSDYFPLGPFLSVGFLIAYAMKSLF